MTLRPQLIAGNWKMNGTLAESKALVEELLSLISDSGAVIPEIMVAPPFTALLTVAQMISGTPVSLGAQDCFWEAKGAFTGEISPVMLKEIGCRYVLVGHSERRHLLKEPEDWIARRCASALHQGLVPVLCIGETETQREAGETFRVLEGQLDRALGTLTPAVANPLVLAYEPVWAIGTGKNATPDEAQEVHAFIRAWLGKRFDKTLENQIKILYGGSVTPANAKVILSQPDIDGVLVGGASLSARTFYQIIQKAR
jgi:triosephosphate isomerase